VQDGKGAEGRVDGTALGDEIKIKSRGEEEEEEEKSRRSIRLLTFSSS
jgi:hypothetical protein